MRHVHSNYPYHNAYQSNEASPPAFPKEPGMEDQHSMRSHEFGNMGYNGYIPPMPPSETIPSSQLGCNEIVTPAISAPQQLQKNGMMGMGTS